MKKKPIALEAKANTSAPGFRSRQDCRLKYLWARQIPNVHIDLQSTTSLLGIALNQGLLSTKPLFSVTDYNSKLAIYLHPRSMSV